MKLILIIVSLMCLPIYFYKWSFTSDKHLKLFVAVTGAFLFGTVMLHLLPELFCNLSFKESSKLGAWVLAGYIFQLLLDYFSKGLEHGHVHGNVGFTMVLALSVHSFFEVIPVFSTAHSHAFLLLGIAFHKLPVAFILANSLSERNKKQSLILLLIFALSAPLGMLVGEGVQMSESIQKPILAIVLGLLLHISTTILFETTANHTFQRKRFLWILFGFVLAFISNNFEYFL